MRNLANKFLLGSALIIVVANGCDATRKMSKQDKGVATGVAVGGVVGGVIGNNTGKGNTAAGVIIGAAVGGIAGGIIGAKMDRQAEKIKNEIPGAKVERIGEGIDVTFDENNPDGSKAGVYFETNKYNLSSNSILALDKLLKIFAEYPETNILIEGHTDDVGTDAYNLGLSQRRAEAVGNYLRNTGLSSDRLIIRWYGESQPKVANDTKENRALNRRVQFVITANEKMKEEAKKEAGN